MIEEADIFETALSMVFVLLLQDMVVDCRELEKPGSPKTRKRGMHKMPCPGR